jgi:translation elongation factor P/translation initiation factor 5A
MVKFLLFSIWLAIHPVHVSLLSIDYAPDKGLFDVFLRVYFDDFLLDSGITIDDQKKLDFTDNDSFTEDILENYINEKLRIIVNGKPMSGGLEKTELSDNELKLKLIFSPVRKVNTVTVKNFIMTSLYTDQANMTILKINDFEQGAKLTAEQTEMTIKIN